MSTIPAQPKCSMNIVPVSQIPLGLVLAFCRVRPMMCTHRRVGSVGGSPTLKRPDA
jgi:hypothetical protein